MIDRFAGNSGRRNRVSALHDLPNLEGDQILIQRIADECKVFEWKKGKLIIKEGDDGQEVYFILSGHIEISVKGKTKRVSRSAPVHIGEMSSLQPNHPRSATVVAKSESVVAGVLTCDQFQALIAEFPEFDRRVRADIYGRAKGWMEPNTEGSSRGALSYRKMGGVALISTIVFAALFLNFFTTSLAIAATAAALMSVVFFFLAWISRAAILWALFAASAATTISSLVPGLRFNFKFNWRHLELDGGYGGEPSTFGTTALLIITALTLYAARKATIESQ